MAKIKVTADYHYEGVVDSEEPNFKNYCQNRDMRFKHERKRTLEDLALSYQQRLWGWNHEDCTTFMFDWATEGVE